MSKINFKNSFLLLSAIVLITSGFFMFAGTASAAAFCSVTADKNTHTTIGGNVVYCDNSLNMWTPTADVAGSETTYTWGSFGTLNDSNGLGSSYPAANYCNTLTYAGYSDWVLPSCQSELDKTNNCQLYQFYASAGATPSWDVNYSSGLYWASTGIGTTAAENMNNTGFVYSNSRTANNSVRCVRSNPTYSVIAGTMSRASGDASSTINIDLASAMEGATVTLTAAPKTGMQMQTGTLTATYNDGSVKTLTLSGSGPYTFTMPAYAVTVTATFVIIPPTLWEFPPMMVGETARPSFNTDLNYMNAISTGSVKVNGVAIDSLDFSAGSGGLYIDGKAFPAAGVYTIIVSATGYADNSVTQTVQNPTITSSSYDINTGYLMLTGLDFNHTGRGINANKITFTGKNSQTYTLTNATTGGAYSLTEGILTLSAVDKAAVNLLLDKYGNNSSDGVYYNLAAATDWQTGAVADMTNQITVSRAPSGTMTATTLSMKGTDTKTINPITITDVGGEIGATNGILILIPYEFGLLQTDPAHAEWNYLNTTATIVNTGTGVVSPTVSYGSGANSNVHNVLSLNVTTPFSSGDSVTISGLSIITTGETTQSHPLLWSIDGGYTFNSTDSGAMMNVDVTAPIFISAYPKTGKVQVKGSRKVSILTNINEDGTSYYVVVPHGAAAPSVAQVIAGHNSADTAAIDAGSVAVTAYSARSFMTAVLGADATQYDIYIVGQDVAGNTTATANLTITTPDADATCPSVSNAATYNAYPTCGAATCNSGYVLSNGTCVISSGNGGESSSGVGGSVLLTVTPTANFLNGELSDLNFMINNGAKVTNIPVVSLNLNADPATVRGYVVSLDANFTNIGISPYPATSTTFTLPSTAGAYTLYLKYYSTSGIYSKVYTQNISLQPLNTPQPVTTLPANTTTPSTSNLFKRALQLGSKGTDVKALQQFLNINGYSISKNGAGSTGNETTTFGPATKAALIKFQKANKISPAAGYFGPITINVVNKK